MTELFELDPASAEPHRARLEAELLAWADGAGRGDARSALRGRLGVPSLEVAGEPCEQELGEDRLGRYAHLRVPLSAGLSVDGLLMRPHGAGPWPLVVAQHGGMGSPELATFRGGANYHGMVRRALALPAVVWAPRIVMPADSAGLDRPGLDRRLRAGGSSLLGLEHARLERALDVVLSRREVDPARTAMVGLSIGGQYALVTAALDRRLGVVVASNPVVHEGWLDELAPLVELATLIAPRPLQLQVGSRDDVVPPSVARAAAPQLAAAYAARGAPRAFAYVEADTWHDFNDDAAWPFVRTHLGEAS